MKRKIKYLSLVILLTSLSNLLIAQDNCDIRVERIIGKKGDVFTIPCKDMVILDIETYSKYRYMEKQFQRLDSAVSGYTIRIDSLDKESARHKDLLEEKIRNKDGIIDQYKHHSEEITAVLEKCKADSEGFVKVYQEKLVENKKLEEKVEKLKRQRRGFLGLSAGMAGVLLLVVLL